MAAPATIHQPLGKLFPVPEIQHFSSAKKSWAARMPGSPASLALPQPFIKPNAGDQGLWGDLASAGVTGGRLGPNKTLSWIPKLQFHMICTSRKSLLYVCSLPLIYPKIISVCWLVKMEAEQDSRTSVFCPGFRWLFLKRLWFA